MEIRKGVNSSGVIVVASYTTPNYHVTPRLETSVAIGGSGSMPTHSVTPTTTLVAMIVAILTIPTKNKRGRPRKYGPNGVVTKDL